MLFDDFSIFSERTESGGIFWENLFLVENFNVNVLDSLDYVVENYEFDSSSFCDGSLNKKIKYINGITVAIENALENIIESMVTVDSMIKEEIIL